MNADASTISWTFGGALAGLPPGLAWSIVIGAAILGVAFICWSYQRAVVALTPARRIALCLIRSLPWLGLLLILAAPTRVHRIYEDPPKARALAVLVDQSDSMTAPDNRQRRRLDDALRRWREMEPLGQKTHGEVKSFVFADGVRSGKPGDLSAGIGTGQTKLFAALQQVLANAPDGGWAGIVTLTDGLDTSGGGLDAGVEATARAALEKSTALYFVPGRNRYAGAPFVGLRDFNAPTRVVPRSTFRVEATFDSFAKTARTIEVQFKVNGVARPTVTLPIEAGRRLTAWSADVPTTELGNIDLELRAGDEIARASVRVERPSSNRILYFQGALDWSYRFLADILKRDPTFVLTPVFNFPNPNAALPPGALRRMPEIPKELDGFDIVVLANAAASQFTNAQQAALSTWVRNGGVVVFFTPDDDSTQGFSGSELERMLPVTFSPPQARVLPSASRVLSRLQGGGGTADPTKLVAFEWERTPRVQEIFAEAEKNKVAFASPLFAEYAHVAQAKPGADVLARHPTDFAANGGEKAILLAVQRYGRGQSAVLTTDALWRWKLNEPATDRSAEIFWQTLFAWLTREHDAGLRFDESPRLAESDREIAFHVVGASDKKLTVEAVQGEKRIPLSEAAAGDGFRLFPWRPPSDGLWQIIATEAGGATAQHWVSVRKTVQSGELSGAPPDEALLRTLAERTGGEVLESTPPPAWQPTRPVRGAPLGEQREPLWHRPWIFATILGLTCVEMILRRKWRML